MRYLRLFSVAFLLIFTITGCHRRRESATPPPQAQAPIVSTLPPEPPLTFPDVQLPKPKPTVPVAHPTPAPTPKPQPTQPIFHRHPRHKVNPENTAAGSSAGTPNPAHAGTGNSSPDSGGSSSDASPADKVKAAPAGATSGTAVLGNLSADDPTADPHANVTTERLIQHTEGRLKKVSKSQRSAHKDAVAQVSSFLAQAKQAWDMNDMVGAQTLVNKAKILLDELESNTLPVP